MKDIQKLSVFPCTGDEITRFIPDIAELRIKVFGEWPYLYDGNLEYEKKYLQTYSASANSVVIICKDGERVVGASTAIPLSHEEDNFKQPMRAAGFIPEEIFYFGESVLLPEYRGLGIGVRFFEEREKFARSFAWCKAVCFCGVVRSSTDPRKPENYVPLDAFWRKRGFSRLDGVFVTYTWKDHDEVKETKKSLQVWLKHL